MHCRFIGQAFSVKLQETESVNNFVKTETNVKNKGQYSVL